MNEAGLTVSAVCLAQSVYEEPQPGTHAISALESVPAVLANYSSVDEVLTMLEAVSVLTPFVPDGSSRCRSESCSFYPNYFCCP